MTTHEHSLPRYQTSNWIQPRSHRPRSFSAINFPFPRIERDTFRGIKKRISDSSKNLSSPAPKNYSYLSTINVFRRTISILLRCSQMHIFLIFQMIWDTLILPEGKNNNQNLIIFNYFYFFLFIYFFFYLSYLFYSIFILFLRRIDYYVEQTKPDIKLWSEERN